MSSRNICDQLADGDSVKSNDLLNTVAGVMIPVILLLTITITLIILIRCS